MDAIDPLQAEIRQIIVDVLVLEEITADEIDPTGPLFGDGLGLDSIDALEIAMALEQRYGVVTEDDPELNQERFASVSSLAAFVAERRTR